MEVGKMHCQYLITSSYTLLLDKVQLKETKCPKPNVEMFILTIFATPKHRSKSWK